MFVATWFPTVLVKKKEKHKNFAKNLKTEFLQNI